MDHRSQQMLTAPPLPLLVKMSTPSSTAFVIQASVSMAEVWFIGSLGNVSLAAIALVFPLLMLTQTLSGGAMGGAVASAIARALGANDIARAEQLIWHALTLALCGALLLLLLFTLFGRSFLTFLGGSGDVLTQAFDYSLILFSGGLFIWLVGVVSAIYRGMGDMQFPALMMALSALIQVPLSGVLITGSLGFPQLGVRGAAISAVISGVILSLVMLIRLVRGNTAIKWRLLRPTFEQRHFRDILNVALPAALSPILTVLTVILITAIVGRFGEQALAGYGIGSRIEFLLIPLVFGIGASMTSLVGISIGAGDIYRAEKIGWVGGLAAALLAGTIGLVLAAFPNAWIPLFSDDPLVQTTATSYIQIVGPWFALHGLGLVLYFGSQGAGAMRWPVIALSIRSVIAVGGALLLTDSISDLSIQNSTLVTSLDGVFYSIAASMAVYGAILMGALKLGAWRHSGRANGS